MLGNFIGNSFSLLFFTLNNNNGPFSIALIAFLGSAGSAGIKPMTSSKTFP
jgi:hypothetical protein